VSALTIMDIIVGIIIGTFVLAFFFGVALILITLLSLVCEMGDDTPGERN